MDAQQRRDRREARKTMPMRPSIFDDAQIRAVMGLEEIEQCGHILTAVARTVVKIVEQRERAQRHTAESASRVGWHCLEGSLVLTTAVRHTDASWSSKQTHGQRVTLLHFCSPTRIMV
jgi:hypothetical protein